MVTTITGEHMTTHQLGEMLIVLGVTGILISVVGIAILVAARRRR